MKIDKAVSRNLICLLLIAFASLATAQSTAPLNSYDPKGYIKENAATEQVDAIRESEVMMDGVKYRRFTSSAGELLVPKLDKISQSDLEKGLCAESGNPKRSIAQVRKPLSSTTTLYAGLVQQVILKRCAPNGVAYNNKMQRSIGATDAVVETMMVWLPSPELGLEFKGKGNDKNSTKKIYLTPMGPGFSSSF